MKALFVFLLLTVGALAQAPSATFSKPTPGSIGNPGEHVLRVKGTVVQVTDHGIIISPWDSITLERVGNKYGAQQMKNSLYIAGPQKKMVDGAIFEGVVYPVGRIKHGNETMHCYADSVELAERLTGKH